MMKEKRRMGCAPFTFCIITVIMVAGYFCFIHPRPLEEPAELMDESRVSVSIKKSVFKQAVKERGEGWGEINIPCLTMPWSSAYITVKVAEGDKFYSHLDKEDAAKNIAEDYPHLFTFEEADDIYIFRMRLSGGYVTIPAFLIVPMIENKLLLIE